MNYQIDIRILSLMLETISKIEGVYYSHTENEILENYVLSDSIEFEFQKLYEDSVRLSLELRITYGNLPIDKLRAIRNRVAHDYEHVSLEILFSTIRNDIPEFKNNIKMILENINK